LFGLCTSHHRFVLTTKVSETLRRLSSTTSDIGRQPSHVRVIASRLSSNPEPSPDGLSDRSERHTESMNSGGGKDSSSGRGMFRRRSLVSCDEDVDTGWSPRSQLTTAEVHRETASYDHNATRVEDLPFSIAAVTVTPF